MKINEQRQYQAPTFQQRLGDQRGMALVLVISLLAVMSVMGIMLISTSSTEIQLSGNFFNKQQAFFTADRAVAYASAGASTGFGVVDLYDDDGGAHLANIEIEVGGSKSSLEKSDYTPADDRNSVAYLASGPPPPGSGSDVTKFQAHSYAVCAVGIFPEISPNPSRVSVRSQVSKIVPK